MLTKRDTSSTLHYYFTLCLPCTLSSPHLYHTSSLRTPAPPSRSYRVIRIKMADEIRIDKQVFENRISHFISAWKADKRSGDALFGGVGSIVVVMGKTEESISFQKNNAMHVGKGHSPHWQTLRSDIWSIRTDESHDPVLVIRLRIPCYLVRHHNRSILHTYYREER